MTEQILDDPSALLKRLSQKPGVKSTLVLSTENGAIIQVSGAIAPRSSAAATNGSSGKRNSVLKSSSVSLDNERESDGQGSKVNGAASADDKKNGERPSEKKGIDCAEDVARLAFDFVKVAGSTIEGLDVEDDVRLLRVRTKKVELVIVPDPKYILVVIHDMPPA